MLFSDVVCDTNGFDVGQFNIVLNVAVGGGQVCAVCETTPDPKNRVLYPSG